MILGRWNWQYWAGNQKPCIGKYRRQAQGQVSERSDWNKGNDINTNSQRELVKRGKKKKWWVQLEI